MTSRLFALSAVLLLLLAPAAARQATAQDTAPLAARSIAPGGVSGTIVDAESSLPLADANVMLEPRSAGVFPAPGAFLRGVRSTRTDAAGRYAFDGVAPGPYRLHVQRLGYRSATVEVEPRGSGGSRVSVGLVVQPVALAPLRVEGIAPPLPDESYGRRVEGDEADERRLAAERLRQRLHLAGDVRGLTHADVREGLTLGETDLFRALQRLPGVSAPDEWAAELWTRGAPWDHTRVYLDGLPLFNPVHALGLFSGVNADAIGAAFLHPGAQPASSPGGAAGMLDLRSRRGGEGQVNGLAELSLVSGRLTLDGSSDDDRHAWMTSWRRSYIDWLADAVGGVTGDPSAQVPYNFYDGISRYDYRVGRGGTLTTSMYTAENNVRGDIPDVLHRTAMKWGGTAVQTALEIPIAGLRSRHTLGGSVFSSTTDRLPADSALDYAFSAPEAPTARNEVGYLAAGGEWAPATGPVAPDSWRAGYDLVWQEANFRGPRPTPYARPDLPDPYIFLRESSLHGAMWAERRWAPSPAVSVETGLRLEAGDAVRNVGSVRLAPRLAGRLRLDEGTTLSAGAGRVFQYTQAVLPAGPAVIPGFHTEYLWVLAGDSVPALRADVATLGVERWLGTEWLGSANAYLRHTTGVAVPDPAAGALIGRPLFVEAAGTSRGVELSARKLAGRWTASAGYTLAASTLEAGGQRWAAPGDQRHTRWMPRACCGWDGGRWARPTRRRAVRPTPASTPGSWIASSVPASGRRSRGPANRVRTARRRSRVWTCWRSGRVGCAAGTSARTCSSATHSTTETRAATPVSTPRRAPSDAAASTGWSSATWSATSSPQVCPDFPCLASASHFRGMDVAALFSEHHPALFRYLARMTGDPDLAADAAQEAFVKLVERPPAPGETRAWLFRVGTNAAREQARTRGRRLRLLEARPERAPVGDAPPAPDEALDAAERRRVVQRALGTLAERDRTILLMREEGFSHREIAAAVETTPGSVGTMIARALARLAAALPLDDEKE